MRRVIVFFGPQGSGKSTQVERLAERLEAQVFEAGEQLRQRAKVDEEIHRLVATGQLVPAATLRTLVEDFTDQTSTTTNIIFDGYPRNHDQCEDFANLARSGQWQVEVIYIHLSDKSAKERLANRFELINGRKVYREDDQPSVVEKRLATFKQTTLPVKDWLAQHYPTFEIDGEPDVDQVTRLINQALKVDPLHETSA